MTPPTAAVQFWPRAELAPAAQRWPELFDLPIPGDYWRTVERNLRAALPGLSILLVPLRVAELAAYLERTGDDVGLEQTREAYAEERVARGDAVPWPPARTEACWCDSGQPYGSCCRRG